MPENKRFVDIHTHILPAVDDGARDLDHAIELLKAAWEQGTGTVVLTPHYRGKYRDNLRAKLTEAFEKFRPAAEKACPGMQLFLGCETGYELDVSEKLADGSVLTLNNTRYVLLEFRDSAFRSRILSGTLEILNFGYIPILAHVERYDAFHNHPELAQELTDLGALLQINADSVVGKHGFALKRFCHKLLKKHLVHFIATDAHDQQLRTPELKACYGRVARKYGCDRADMLFFENAHKMLSGREDIEC